LKEEENGRNNLSPFDQRTGETDAIDRNSEGQPEREIVNPPREVRIKLYPENSP
jgi:hypothetical protein